MMSGAALRLCEGVDVAIRDRAMLTQAQRKALRTADSRGVVMRPPLMNGFARASWERMMNRMVPTYVTAYVHGGYELTDAGRREAASTSTTR